MLGKFWAGLLLLPVILSLSPVHRYHPWSEKNDPLQYTFLAYIRGTGNLEWQYQIRVTNKMLLLLLLLLQIYTYQVTVSEGLSGSTKFTEASHVLNIIGIETLHVTRLFETAIK